MSIQSLPSREDIIESVRTRLEAGGVADAAADAATIANWAAKWPDDVERFIGEVVARRLAGESLGRIAGYKMFAGVAVSVVDGVFEPCTSTERLVEYAVAWASVHAPAARVLDVGTGVGNVLLASLQALPAARGVGVDCNGAAVAAARANAVRNGLSGRAEFVEGDVHELSLRGFDVVLSSLPWVPSRLLGALAPEARRDPIEALDGGADGLQHFRRLAPSLRQFLVRGGRAFLQAGYEQVAKVETLMRTVPVACVERLRDGYGIPCGVMVEV